MTNKEVKFNIHGDGRYSVYFLGDEYTFTTYEEAENFLYGFLED